MFYMQKNILHDINSLNGMKNPYHGVYIKKKSSGCKIARRTDPQLTDKEYLSQHKRFELDEILTQYGIYIERKILQVTRAPAVPVHN